MKKKLYVFEGERADVDWDARLCIHIAECGRSEGELFVTGRKPWCQPDLADNETVLDVVTRCPTGALSYRSNDGSEEVAAQQNTVHVTSRGPLFFQGELEIDGAADDMAGVKFRAALCRCGHSKNKPFCDNAHIEAGFDDAGAVGRRATALSSEGALKVTRAPNGPLIVEGPVRVFASSGRAAFAGDKVALCRCGHSKDKPFCDGSHKDAGFTAD